MLLSDRKVQTAKPSSKKYSLSDGDGLSLVVYPAGGKYWRFRFTIGQDRREMSFGTYPEVPLAEARSRRAEARSSVAAGNDPNQEIAKPDTFGDVAREYMERQIAGGLAAQTIAKNERFLFTHASVSYTHLDVYKRQPSTRHRNVRLRCNNSTMSKNAIETAEDIAEGLDQLAQNCTTMANIIAQVREVPLRRRPANFASLASIIISQQVSKQSAAAIFGRMEKIIAPLSAENYLMAGETAWLEIGLSRPKQQTFIALCNAIRNEQLQLETLASLPAQEAIDTMVSVKGIGPWTAEVFLLTAVGHPDVFPAGDLALQVAAADAYQSGQRMSEKELRLLAESWAPWRSVAARILWAYYAVLKNRIVIP